MLGNLSISCNPMTQYSLAGWGKGRVHSWLPGRWELKLGLVPILVRTWRPLPWSQAMLVAHVCWGAGKAPPCLCTYHTHVTNVHHSHSSTPSERARRSSEIVRDSCPEARGPRGMSPILLWWALVSFKFGMNSLPKRRMLCSLEANSKWPERSVRCSPLLFAVRKEFGWSPGRWHDLAQSPLLIKPRAKSVNPGKIF